MLSYFKYYIIKTQQARKSIVLKLCDYAAAFRPDVWGCGPTSGRVLGGCRNITGNHHLASDIDYCLILKLLLNLHAALRCF